MSRDSVLSAVRERFFFPVGSMWSGEADSYELSTTLDTHEMGFLQDHVFGGSCLVPGAVMADLLVEAALLVDGGETAYPLRLERLEIFRGIQIDIGDAQDVAIKGRIVGERTHELDLVYDKKQENGIVRKGIKVATARVRLGADLPVLDPVEPAPDRRFRLGQQGFYDTFVHTHGERFQTLNGDFSLDEDANRLVVDFDIADKERGFSADMREFEVSPLVLDSILQMAVTFSVLRPPEGDGDAYNTKLPVLIENLEWVGRPPERGICSVDGRVIAASRREMTISASLVDSRNQVVGRVGSITLREAPFVTMSREAILGIFERWRRL